MYCTLSAAAGASLVGTASCSSARAASLGLSSAPASSPSALPSPATAACRVNMLPASCCRSSLAFLNQLCSAFCSLPFSRLQTALMTHFDCCVSNLKPAAMAIDRSVRIRSTIGSMSWSTSLSPSISWSWKPTWVPRGKQAAGLLCKGGERIRAA